MEAATKKKRGRPPLYSQEFYDGIAALFPTQVSRRTLTNFTYVTEGYETAKGMLGAEAAETAFNGTTAHLWGQGILEQVGRMRLQDGYSVNDCELILKTALRLHSETDLTSRDIERWIRHGRKTGNFFAD